MVARVAAVVVVVVVVILVEEVGLVRMSGTGRRVVAVVVRPSLIPVGRRSSPTKPSPANL